MKTTLTRDLEDDSTCEIVVEFEISRYYPATRESPEEGGEAEYSSAVRLDTGEEVELTDKELAELESWAAKNAPDGPDGDDFEPSFDEDRCFGGIDW